MTSREISEAVVQHRRLGRHVNHDARSLAYPFKAPGVTLTSHRWSSATTAILDQGDLGSCTGNATVGALLCEPFFSRLDATQQGSLDEDLAVEIYSKATGTDPFPGTYPPTDTGSDGLDVAKAATALGYITGYTHAFTLDDALTAMTIGPVIVGINWYQGFDNPTTSGEVAISGSVRGGHEVCLDEIDVAGNSVWFRNSWGTGWGLQGRAHMAFSTLQTLMGQQGDVTVFTPLGVSPPPPTPTPTADETLAEAAHPWVVKPRKRPTNEALRQSLLTWLNDKGL